MTKKSLNFLSESYIFRRHRVKKQKQIDEESADRSDPSSTFRLYVVKFGPNVFQILQNVISKEIKNKNKILFGRKNYKISRQLAANSCRINWGNSN